MSTFGLAAFAALLAAGLITVVLRARRRRQLRRLGPRTVAELVQLRASTGTRPAAPEPQDLPADTDADAESDIAPPGGIPVVVADAPAGQAEPTVTAEAGAARPEPGSTGADATRGASDTPWVRARRMLGGTDSAAPATVAAGVPAAEEAAKAGRGEPDEAGRVAGSAGSAGAAGAAGVAGSAEQESGSDAGGRSFGAERPAAGAERPAATGVGSGRGEEAADAAGSTPVAGDRTGDPDAAPATADNATPAMADNSAPATADNSAQDAGVGAPESDRPAEAAPAASTDGGPADAGSVSRGSLAPGAGVPASAGLGPVGPGSVAPGAVPAAAVDSEPVAGPVVPESVDSGSVDSGSVDSGSVDSGSVDSESVDSESAAPGSVVPVPVDAAVIGSPAVSPGATDSASVDPPAVDPLPVDSLPVDSLPVDSLPVDSAVVDSAVVDSPVAGPAAADSSAVGRGSVDPASVDPASVGSAAAAPGSSTQGLVDPASVAPGLAAVDPDVDGSDRARPLRLVPPLPRPAGDVDVTRPPSPDDADRAVLGALGLLDPAAPPEPVLAPSGVDVQSESEPDLAGPGQPLRFRVTRRDGSALPGAEVTLLDQRGDELVTGFADAQGHGELLAPRPGDLLLLAAAPGHQPAAAAVSIVDSPVDVGLVLSRSAALAGAVRGPHGPVVTARLTLVQDGEIVDAAHSDTAGEYRIGGLAAGGYSLSATAPGCVPVAVRVELPAEAEARRDIALERDTATDWDADADPLTMPIPVQSRAAVREAIAHR